MNDPTNAGDFLQEWKAEQKVAKAKQVECLGHVFPDEKARRDHFLALLAIKLAEPEFRKQAGFPKADDAAILRMSDPPYYTACPNPFLSDLVKAVGEPYKGDPYYRVPFAVDMSEGKADHLYQAHVYHTKVPHLAIVPCILHYTKPGDVVLDGFCGSGMVGVAAQWCGCPDAQTKIQIEHRLSRAGLDKPQWGARVAVLNDLSPAATFITANMNIPFDVALFESRTKEILKELRAEIGWMYTTKSESGKDREIEFTLWGEMFSCPECSAEIDFSKDAVDADDQSVRGDFPCNSCGANLTKDKLNRVFESTVDKYNGEIRKHIKFRPIKIAYKEGGKLVYKLVDSDDLKVIARIESLPLPPEAPTGEFPIADMYHGSRLKPKGVTRVHHLFVSRALHALCHLWRKASDEKDHRMRNALLFYVEQAIWTSSILNRFQPQGFKQVNKYLPGVYYIPSQTCEVSPWYAIESRGKRLAKTFEKFRSKSGMSFVTTGTTARINLDNECIDYIYTDPPFGENIFYADLNFVVESWHHAVTDADPEAIVDKFKKKNMFSYQRLMHECFSEYFRVLKPGRWMTMVFSNSKNAVWVAIQESLSKAGFIVADVRSLDKELGSFRQVTSTAVKQDLVVTVYKANGGLEDRFNHLADGTPEGAWDFVRTHLKHVPISFVNGERLEPISERTAYALYDRMTAFHVQRQRRVPLSSAEFRQGLEVHFAERDGMYFLPEQVAEYDGKRMTIGEIQQLTINVTDEGSAISWLRQELRERPREIQELFNDFKKQLTVAWPKHESPPELRTLLEENFLLFTGDGQIPPQIHAYLSSNFKELRNLDKANASLVAKATGRWFVPDPKRQGDVDKLREKRLLKEFQHLVEEPARKLKTFRLEAIRAGFREAWQKKTKEAYETIIRVAEKIPEEVLQGDDKLLMYYDQAQTRIGNGP